MRPTSNKRLLPYIFFEDLAKAIPWLIHVFGFEERFRLDLPNGAIAHAELQIGDGVIMLGNVGARNTVRPVTVRSSVYVFVDDVDAHHENAKSRGAEIVKPPAEQPFGDRIYLAFDLEGHEWYFAQHVRDVEVEELKKMIGGV